MNNVKKVFLCGVGGQGTILSSKIFTEGLIKAGYDVKMSEVHGMAQRGGSVITQVIYGEKVYSPLFGKGQADIGVAFERMEAVRYAEYLKPDGVCIINDYQMAPMSVAAGSAEYPENAVEAMTDVFDSIVIPAADIAVSLGNARSMNIVLLGALVRTLGLDDLKGSDWPGVIRSIIPEKLQDINIEAFRAGFEYKARS